MSDATATMEGNLVAEPELRFTQTGTPQCNVTLAVNRRYQKAGEWVEEVSFFDAVIWSGMGENAAESLHKGDRVVLEGRVEQARWQNDDGETRSRVRFVADKVGLSLRFGVVTGFEKRTKAGNAMPVETAEAGDPGARQPVSVGAPAAEASSDEEPF